MSTSIDGSSATTTKSQADQPLHSAANGKHSLKLLTFNTWGLKYVSKHRAKRLRAIADRLAGISTDDGSGSTDGYSTSTNGGRDADDYDIVALQEIWTEEDWNYLDKVCANRFPYRRCFSSGILTGPGLAVLSKVPINRTFLYRFPINGRPSAFFRGDWYVGKSVAVTFLEPTYENATPIALLNSHMHAPYSLTGDAAYSCHRACQAWDIASLVQTITEGGYAAILVGDLNSRPGSLPYRILQHEAGLNDSWEVLHGAIDLEEVKKMDPRQQIKRAGTTCDSTLNTWRASRELHEACRLDYALINSSKLSPVAASVEFTEQIPEVGSYSDHFAYSATLDVLPRTADVPPPNKETLAGRLAVYDDLTSLVEEYLSGTNVWQSRLRLLHFLVSLVVFIAFLPVIVVVSFIAPWSSILFYLFGSVIIVTGVVDGLIGLLFGRNEKRALREVLNQVDDRVRGALVIRNQSGNQSGARGGSSAIPK